MKWKAKPRGFTRLDIMIAAALGALVAALAIPHVRGGRGSAQGAAAVWNLRALLSSWEMYRPVSR
jgi:Tfp pilus assembly protein FimT